MALSVKRLRHWRHDRTRLLLKCQPGVASSHWGLVSYMWCGFLLPLAWGIVAENRILPQNALLYGSSKWLMSWNNPSGNIYKISTSRRSVVPVQMRLSSPYPLPHQLGIFATSRECTFYICIFWCCLGIKTCSTAVTCRPSRIFWTPKSWML